MRELATDPCAHLAALAGRLGVEWPWSVEETVAFARSRLTGDYAVDEFGFDPEFTTKIFLPLLRPLVQTWFRVEVRGGENLPTTGSALLVSNHAGTLPLDGMILHAVVYDEIARHVRMLGADLIFKTPYSHDLARKTGTTLACQEDAERLLASRPAGRGVPRGLQGPGQAVRGPLQAAAVRPGRVRLGRGPGPGADHPGVHRRVGGDLPADQQRAGAGPGARACRTSRSPRCSRGSALLGLVPLPSKWMIEFGEAVTTDELPPGAAEDPMVVFNVTDQVRETIQHTLYECLTQRRSAFF